MKNKLIIINSFDYGSTGTLCEYLKTADCDTFSKPIFLVSQKQEKNIADYSLFDHSSKLLRFLATIKNKLFNKYGFSSKILTKRALKYVLKNTNIKEEQLILSIHQIESSLFDLKSLIKFAEKYKAKIFFTLHDCWAFTGKCAYYNINNCYSWKYSKCLKCKFYKDFPTTFSKHLFNRLEKKNNLFKKVFDRLTFICPSKWIMNELLSSELKSFKCVVINNGVDIRSSKPLLTSGKVKIISAAYPWTKRKGLEYIEALSNVIDYDKFELTVVGVDEATKLNKNVKVIGRTNRDELLNLFRKSDYFLNPTLEDNFPTVNIEAMSCGLKVIAFKSGGACEAFDENTGFGCNPDLESLCEIISKLSKNMDKEKCISRALSLFSKDKFVRDYYNLFKL